MPRGKARCRYETDQGLFFWTWVDRDALADPNRGWILATVPAQTPLSRGLLPRRVVGTDELGHTRYARVGTPQAPLWTGVVATWVFEGSDGLPHTATRIGRQEERLSP